jgi:hypothetical protein
MAEEIALPLSSRAPSAHDVQANLSSVVYLKKFFTEVIAVCVHQPPIDPYGSPQETDTANPYVQAEAE